MKNYFYFSPKLLTEMTPPTNNARNDLTALLYNVFQTRSCSNSQRLSVCSLLHELTGHTYAPEQTDTQTLLDEEDISFPFHELSENQVFELETILDLASSPERLNELHNLPTDELKRSYIAEYLLSRPNVLSYSNFQTDGPELILYELNEYLSNPSSYLSEYVCFNSTWYYFSYGFLDITQTD